MTNDRSDGTGRDEAPTRDDISDAALERLDVQNALAVEGDLPEGAGGGMDQAAPNLGARMRPAGGETEQRQEEAEPRRRRREPSRRPLKQRSSGPRGPSRRHVIPTA